MVLATRFPEVQFFIMPMWVNARSLQSRIDDLLGSVQKLGLTTGLPDMSSGYHHAESLWCILLGDCACICVRAEEKEDLYSHSGERKKRLPKYRKLTS